MNDIVKTLKIMPDLEHCNIVLISPRANQLLYLSELVSEWQSACLVALHGDSIDLPTFLQQTVTYLLEQFPGLKSQLGDALSRKGTKPEALADALFADINNARCLVIDNFDLARLDHDFARFFSHILKQKSGQTQVIIKSRTIDHVFWNPLIATGNATVIGADDEPQAAPRSRTPNQQPYIEVFALRGGAVYVDGLPVKNWEGPLVRDLFSYLADHPLITRDEIFSTFWPTLSQKEATNVFHVTKRKIAQCLGMEFTDYRAGFYQPSAAFDLYYDVAAFEAANPQTEADFKAAIRLHRHPFLDPRDAPWIRSRRRELQNRYIEMLVGLARLYRSSKRLDLAIIYYGRVRQQVPEREDVARALMELYAASGDSSKVRQVYDQLVHNLYERWHIKPSAATREVYETLNVHR